MAKHMDDINNLNVLLAEIPAGTPILPDGLSDVDCERRRKEIIQLTLHASDISFLMRPWETQKTQAYKLFEEFFH